MSTEIRKPTYRMSKLVAELWPLCQFAQQPQHILLLVSIYLSASELSSHLQTSLEIFLPSCQRIQVDIILQYTAIFEIKLFIHLKILKHCFKLLHSKKKIQYQKGEINKVNWLNLDIVHKTKVSFEMKAWDFHLYL